MRVDLHMHTLENSDGKDPVREMIRAGIERGLNGLVVTDHHYLLSRDEQRRLQDEFPDFRIFRGCESSIDADDILLIGGSGDSVPWEKRISTERAGEMAAYVRDTGAFAVWAHPFWRADEVHFDMDIFCPEGIEMASMNVNTAQYERIFKLAREWGMLPTAGSDAHNARHVGLFHLVLDEWADDDEALTRILREGRYATGTFEDMWQARYEEFAGVEALANEVLAEGGTLETFVERGGNPGAWKRPARGASYVPSREVIGIRPDLFR